MEVSAQMRTVNTDFWGTVAYTLIGGTFAGTILTLVFLPALYAIWFRIRPATGDRRPAGRQAGTGASSAIGFSSAETLASLRRSSGHAG